MADEFPAGLQKYSQSPVFTEATIPDALQKDHSTKALVWGKLVVSRGALTYVRDGHASQTVQAGETATIFPEEKHHVTPNGEVTFQVEFYRTAAKGKVS